MGEQFHNLCLSSYQSFKEQLLSGTRKIYSVIGHSIIRLLLYSEKQWNICRRLIFVLIWGKCPGLELVSLWVRFLRLYMQTSLCCGGMLPDLSFHSFTSNVWSWSLEKLGNIVICSHCRVLGNNFVKSLLLNCVVYYIILYIVLWYIVLYSTFTKSVVHWLFHLLNSQNTASSIIFFLHHQTGHDRIWLTHHITYHIFFW